MNRFGNKNTYAGLYKGESYQLTELKWKILKPLLWINNWYGNTNNMLNPFLMV
jgi:hypothetical protein